MSPVVAVIAPGAMGAAVGKRLADNGLMVLTSLDGRSEETRARAKAAGMTAAKDDDIARADFILSILPPGDALSLGRSRRPSVLSSMPESSASRRSLEMPGRASMRLAPRRRVLPRCAITASISVSLTAK